MRLSDETVDDIMEFVRSYLLRHPDRKIEREGRVITYRELAAKIDKLSPEERREIAEALVEAVRSGKK